MGNNSKPVEACVDNNSRTAGVAELDFLVVAPLAFVLNRQRPSDITVVRGGVSADIGAAQGQLGQRQVDGHLRFRRKTLLQLHAVRSLARRKGDQRAVAHAGFATVNCTW